MRNDVSLAARLVSRFFVGLIAGLLLGALFIEPRPIVPPVYDQGNKPPILAGFLGVFLLDMVAWKRPERVGLTWELSLALGALLGAGLFAAIWR